MASNSEIRFYIDTMIVETILSEPNFLKKAEGNVVSNITDSVKNYVGAHIDPNDKEGSLLNILAPGAISVTFAAMGLGWVGVLISFAMRIFNIDVKGIISSIYNGIKELISGDKKVTSAQIDGLVNSAVQEHASNEPDLSKMPTASVNKELMDAKMIKLALIAYDEELRGLKKQSDLSSMFKSRRSKTTSVLSRVFSWIFKVALASAGFMVAGDAVNKLLDRPNAFDGSLKDGKPVENVKETIVDAPKSTQTKFPVKSGYVDTRYNTSDETNWIEKTSNNKSSIENMLVSFVKEVYDGLDNQDSLIKSVPGFQITADNIAWYNHSSVGDPIVFIPRHFISKKQLVDNFIDQIAASTGANPTPVPNTAPNNIKPNLDRGERSA